MEESIRNAEKLIEAANSTLARMKINTTFDDFNFLVGANKKSVKKKPKFQIDREDVTNFLSLKETVPDFDELFTLNRNTIASDRKAEDIDNLIESYARELHDREERDSLRALHFDRHESDTNVNADWVVPATKTASDTNVSQKSVTKIKPITEDLKSKLRQTQDIVDRGIQTARELSDTVVLFANKSPKKDRCDELSLNRSKSSERLGKSDSRSSVNTGDFKRCRKCNCEIRTKRKTKSKADKSEDNIHVINIKEINEVPEKHKKLNLQRLPSLNIQGDLNRQKIPSVNIPPGKRECIPIRENTAIQTYSHENILRNKIEHIIENLKSDSITCLGVKGSKCVECTNCGKVLTIRGDITDTRQIDDLLKICDYNVFDPRIEEFAERCKVKVDEEAKCTQTEEGPKSGTGSPKQDPTPRSVRFDEVAASERKTKIKDISFDVTRKYREKAAELESDHMHFENILRELFKQVDQSRDVFNDCVYLSAVASEEKRKSSLRATTPVLLSYTGSGEEVDEARSTVMRSNRGQKVKMSSKEIRKKLGKRELDVNSRLISSSRPVIKDKAEETANAEANRKESHSTSININADESDKSKKEFANKNKANKMQNKVQTKGLQLRQLLTVELKDNSKPEENSIPRLEPKDQPQDKPMKQNKQQKSEDKEISDPSPKEHQRIKEKDMNETKESPKPAQSPQPNNINSELAEESIKHTTASDYESDFEEDSVEEQPQISEKDDSYKYNTRLSTISEVDSDTDKKVTDSAKEKENVPTEEQPSPVLAMKLDLGSICKKTSSSSSSDDDDTRKLLKRVNRDLKEIASQELLTAKRDDAVKALHQQMSEPLKEVLNALKNQFQRTEILADKLTESIKEVKKSEQFPGNADLMMVNNLEKVRKEVERKKSGLHIRRSSEGEILSDSSSDRSSRSGKRKGKAQSDGPKLGNEVRLSSIANSKPNSDDKSYSEGEISELDFPVTEQSSPSIGEVINENFLDGTLSDENSLKLIKLIS